LVLIAAVFVGWRALDSQLKSESEPVAASTAPAAVGVTPVSTAAAPSRVVEIKAVADAWLEARGPDGTVFLSRTLRAGDVYRPDASPGWTLHARDGGAFELYVNGMSAGLLGTAGMPVLGRSIDEIQPLTQASTAPPPTCTTSGPGAGSSAAARGKSAWVRSRWAATPRSPCSP
jgi:hypothetical protein